jgi:hypothetical protein
MSICGCIIIKNAIINDYPVVEAIHSLLPIVDKLYVSIGESDDETEALIRNIVSPKIEIKHSVWDMSLREGGRVLAVETDKILRQVPSHFDWIFYLQADELLHEKYHAAIQQALVDHHDNPKVDGLLFKYTHFYGTYDYVGDSRKWYPNEIRIIRNNPNIYSYRDAQGFRKRENIKLNAKPINAYIYHYGWVKTPAQMMLKMKNLAYLWNNSEDMKTVINPEEVFDYDQFDSLEKFTDTHPKVMQERIAKHDLKANFDINKKRFGFKDFLLYKFEKWTGIRLFDYKNYKII